MAMMSVIIIAIIVIVVAVIVGFVAFLAIRQLQDRRRGGTGASLFPGSFKGVFGGSSERESGTRFAALDVDEAWDSHVDEEMGYDSVRMQDNRRKESLSREELDDRYEEVMEGGDSSNPFGSGSTSVQGKSNFREDV